MRKVDIDTNYGQVAGTIENHYAARRAAPPQGHPSSRVCPQCHAETWRLTQWCVHCGADLFAIDERARERRVSVRSARVSLFLLAAGCLAFYCQSYAPQAARLWVMGFGMFSIALAAAVIKK